MGKSYSTRVQFPILAPVANGDMPVVYAASANKNATAVTRHGMQPEKKLTEPCRA